MNADRDPFKQLLCLAPRGGKDQFVIFGITADQISARHVGAEWARVDIGAVHIRRHINLPRRIESLVRATCLIE